MTLDLHEITLMDLYCEYRCRRRKPDMEDLHDYCTDHCPLFGPHWPKIRHILETRSGHQT